MCVTSHHLFLCGINDHTDSTSTTFQPFFLNFYKVHSLALQFFLRMWNESGASTGDFPRLVALTRSQYVLVALPVRFPGMRTLPSILVRVKVALKRENIRPWHEVEQEFLDCEYRAVRDRQMQELEMEDDIMSKIPVR